MHYDYIPITHRRPLRWPHDKRIALIITVNLETWDLVKDTVSGCAYRVRALREFIRYAQSLPGVWFATREEIASWYLANHAAHIPAAPGARP